VQTAEFHYDLPADLIAQAPLEERDQSRLLVLDRSSQKIAHKRFLDLPDFLEAGDLLVFNNSKVIPARLRGQKAESGGEIEMLLVEEKATNVWWVMLRPGKRVRPGSRILLRGTSLKSEKLEATVLEKNPEGHCLVEFVGTSNIRSELSNIGEVPLPPYIERGEAGPTKNDQTRYQTIFAKTPGSVAAPTAGLHFTNSVLEQLAASEVPTAEVTLHVGLGTFAPVKAERIEEHQMHEERFEVSQRTAALIAGAKAAGKRVVAVGTTSLRVLESVAEQNEGSIRPCSGHTRIFIYPPRNFRVVDALLTNFHLPESTLLMLVSAFAAPGSLEGRELILRAYTEAIREHYRFFSYGDAMLIV
jgi:S-adenosylmethionine:tRNA ribosyltransferase-isomerase